jgi:hypothetical protein
MPWRKAAKSGATIEFFKKMPRENKRPMGENSANPVTLPPLMSKRKIVIKSEWRRTASSI